MKVTAYIVVQKVVELDLPNDVTAEQVAELLDTYDVPEGYEWCASTVISKDGKDVVFEF
jgi:hypothetical protein